ncbi:MAG: bifunctional proline dehydrogenase/L-glutamate gamma-semialdehyde dehydrogenase PutA [Sphingorhabdus sp.]
MAKLSKAISDHYTIDESELLAHLIGVAALDGDARRAISDGAGRLIGRLRGDAKRLSPMDALLKEYGLSNSEGVILMRIAEALIRTPDDFTRNLLLRDKLIEGDWGVHFGAGRSATVNAATAGLSLAKGWAKLSGGVDARNLFARLGDKLMQSAVSRVIAMMAGHFVLGSDIKAACQRSEQYERDGFAFSYDMLGEAAHTAEDAERYFAQYLGAAEYLAARRGGYERSKAPSISVKLSALHPRYEYIQKDRCLPALVDKLVQLCSVASEAGFGLTIDAEETDRLELSLLIFDALLGVPELKDWTGLGIVVQAYQRRALPVIEQVAAMARAAGRRINMRLVKGAYWDSEIKRAQELGLASYPVFTRKENTDLSYLACARKLLEFGDVIFPAFATHNAHTAAAVQHMAQEKGAAFEFQRLHGMGGALHSELLDEFGVTSRIYAPVGRHKELLPYLVRRLLENGANSSFVNQLADEAVDVAAMTRDPSDTVRGNGCSANSAIPAPRGYLPSGRKLAGGADWTQADEASRFAAVIKKPISFTARPIIGGMAAEGDICPCNAPYDEALIIGQKVDGTTEHIDRAVLLAKASRWSSAEVSVRANALRRAADMLENDADAFINLCVHEAGKTVPDAIDEIREAVDFCRYYADEAAARHNTLRQPLGTLACISPWNFPLAIFVGQIAAALVMGNIVIAKPAEQAPLIACRAVKLLHAAGIPEDALHLIIGNGAELGSHLTRQADIAGVIFTGSTRTAKAIATSLASTGRALIPLIAETGGINAMIIDSTALLEQAVMDVAASAFQSAGQRCSACRIVCVQEDIAEDFENMLAGAMAELEVGPPYDQAYDVGPVIDAAALANIARHAGSMRAQFRVIGESAAPASTAGHYFAPIAFAVPKLAAVSQEIFGPVLHVVRFAGNKLGALIAEINALGFGLTLGLHSRIDARIDDVAAQARIGNIYVNRNQIGAVVGVQPFGGEGLSGTGPKAGGPHYLARLSRTATPAESEEGDVDSIFARAFANAEADFEPPRMLAGPTGESNQLSLHPRGTILCLGGEDREDLARQIANSMAAGNRVIAVIGEDGGAQLADIRRAMSALRMANDRLEIIEPLDVLEHWLFADEVHGVACDDINRAEIAGLLARREGAIIPMLSGRDDAARYGTERTLTIDLTAAGGNAELLSAS